MRNREPAGRCDVRARRRPFIVFIVLAGLGVLGAHRGRVGSQRTPESLFDPRRPPERELEMSIAEGFTVAAVGDCILSRPLSATLGNDAGFAAIVKILRGADVTFGNFENTAIDIRGFQGHSHGGKDDWSLVAAPEVAKDLKTLGFDILSRANNHAMDWGIEGMRETSRWLDEAGLVHAGTGEDRIRAS